MFKGITVNGESSLDADFPTNICRAAALDSVLVNTIIYWIENCYSKGM